MISQFGLVVCIEILAYFYSVSIITPEIRLYMNILSGSPGLADYSAQMSLDIWIGILRNIDTSSEPWAYKLISNLLTISMHKNLTLSGRSFHTSPKTIRGRVMSYLNTISLRNGKLKFTIPFDRQQMADYLNVERTALSKELAKMEADGLIRFRKNHFELLSPDSF